MTALQPHRLNGSEARRTCLGPVDSPSKVSTSNSTEEQDNLKQEPGPAAGVLLGSNAGITAAATGTSTVLVGTTAAASAVTANGVQVLSLERDDIVVVAQLTSLGGETQVSNRRNGDVGVLGVEVEALDPGVLGLVLKFQGERFVLEVGETGLGGNGGVTETASLS